MASQPTSTSRRADAERNRERILEVARSAFAEAGDPVSMAEIARRAGVGMATLYRNFPGRPQLLEALYVEEVDAMCVDSENLDGATPGAMFELWVLRFVEFSARKHGIAMELLEQTDDTNPVFDGSRNRVLTFGRPLFEAAQASGEIRPDLTLEQVLDLVIAVSGIRGEAAYREPIFGAALDGIRVPRD